MNNLFNLINFLR